MSQRARVRDEMRAGPRPAREEPVSPSIRRRRAAAAAARRRRLLLVDVGLGLAIALFGLLLAPGLAIVALVLILALLALGASVFFKRLRRRRGAAARRAPGERTPRRSAGPRRQG